MALGYQKKNKKSGFGLIEIVIGSAIISTAIVALLSTFALYTRYAVLNQNNIQAALLTEEVFEGLKFMRDSGWTKYISPLTSGTAYQLAFSGGLWTATTTPQPYVDGIFLRTVTLDPVYRDGSSDIATSGTLDTAMRKVTVSIAYNQKGATTTTSSVSYIANLFSN